MGRQTASVPGKPAFRAKQVGDLIKTERENNRWTQAELARQAGVAKQVVSNIERGSVTASVNTLAAVAHALGMTIHDVINVGFGTLTTEEQELAASSLSLLRKMNAENRKLALSQLRTILTWQRERSR
jgi:transcriptional regulator with XRE-family HTH domain